MWPITTRRGISEQMPIRKHADIRIARRASTIANLARVISERSVSSGLRRTLATQARRLESLSSARLKELEIPDPTLRDPNAEE